MNRIIYSSPYVPAEWIEAHGLTPERLMPKTVTADCAVDRLEGLCPYARAFLDSILKNRRARGAVITTTCDQMRRGYELLADTGKRDCFLMNIPKTRHEAAKGLYKNEILRLGRFLNGLGGKSPSQEKLSSIMLKYNPSPKHKSGAIPAAIIGGPLMKGDCELFDIIEQFGGFVGLDGTETGSRGEIPPFDKTRIHNDALGELVNAYFYGIPDPSVRPNTDFYDWLKRELKAGEIKGIILRRYLWCDLWHAEFYRIKQETGLPVLEIDVDGDGPLSERTKQRIIAFMEVITCSMSRQKLT